LLDTNICIHIRRHHPPEVRRVFEDLDPGEAVLSVITFGELIYGAEKSRERARSFRAIEELTTLVPVLPLPREASQAYGKISVALEAKGTIIGNNDLWIAAHALAMDLTLVTTNEREFRRVGGLKVENWVP